MEHMDKTDLKCLKNRSVGHVIKDCLLFFVSFFICTSVSCANQSEGEERLLHALEGSPPK